MTDEALSPQPESDAPSAEVPLTERRRAFGLTLRSLREARGLTVAGLAQTTRIGAHFIEALETGALERLPGQVFGRGYVRCLAKSMGIESTTLISEFDGLWEGPVARSVLKVEIKSRPTKPRSEAYASFVANARSFVKSGVPLRLSVPVVAGLGLIYAVVATPLVATLVRRARSTAASVAALRPTHHPDAAKAKHAPKGTPTKSGRSAPAEVEAVTDTGDIAVDAPAGGAAAAAAADLALLTTASAESTVDKDAAVATPQPGQSQATVTDSAARVAAAREPTTAAAPAPKPDAATVGRESPSAAEGTHGPAEAAAALDLTAAKDGSPETDHAAAARPVGEAPAAVAAAATAAHGRTAPKVTAAPALTASEAMATAGTAAADSEALTEPAAGALATAHQTAAAPPADHAAPTSVPTEDVASSPNSGSQVLELVVSKPVRIKLDVDQGQQVVKELAPNTYRFTFASKVDMMVYDASALKISFNGRSLGTLGGKGRVRRLSFMAAAQDDKKL